MPYVEKKYGTARRAAEDSILLHMRHACRINKATNTHSEYVIIVAFPPATVVTQTLVLRATPTTCIVFFSREQPENLLRSLS